MENHNINTKIKYCMENIIFESLVRAENFEIIKEMTKTTPNDAELGRLIRKWVVILESKQQPEIAKF